MTDPSYRAAASNILDEAIRASKLFPRFHSGHEGYAVIAEELDELWDEVKADRLDRAAEEAVQVGAMAIRFIVDLGGHK